MPRPHYRRGGERAFERNPWGIQGRPNRPQRPPPGLRGKEIGLYYRDLRKNEDQSKKNPKQINLKIPPVIVMQIQKHLIAIDKIAEKEKTQLPVPTKPYSKEAKTYDDVQDKEMKDNIMPKEVFDKPTKAEFKAPLNYKDVAGSSQGSDYIKIDSESLEEYADAPKLLALRGGGDYKYSYQDIITGSFEEKLEECLAKGVEIKMKNDSINELNEKLYDNYIAMCKKSKYIQMMEFRKILPTHDKGRDILDIIKDNQVVVISGETGCGKSTQVPQIILDDALRNKRAANVKILVTQPRRIAASSLAYRVAEERGEKPGNSVGYAVRLENIDPTPRASILFCTTGILLAELEVNQALGDYSHIILDEVHERDSFIDLSMCMLKQVLKKRKDLKLILMSATLDADKLCSYYEDCPRLHVPGLAYPVKDYYLEDILKFTGYQLPPGGGGATAGGQRHRGPRGRHARKEMENEIKYRAEISPWLESKKRDLDPVVYRTLTDYRIEMLDINLIVELLKYICRGPEGAVLVFLPGIGEITKCIRSMGESGAFPENRYAIYPLHSKLHSLEQHKIFEKARSGVRKIIVATNIAETSITIDDIVYVVDCGKLKMKGLNVEQNISTLEIDWVSLANLTQRRGRAGRCQPGICYHVVSSGRAALLPSRLLPELQRSDLLEAVLTVKRLRLGTAAAALGQAPDPPATETIQWAVKHLQQCGALNSEETLTPLGWHLARLPVPPAAGKLLLFGALFGCLDRAASVATTWGFKDPFTLVIGKETETKIAKHRLALGEPSDHVAISEAIISWENCSSYRQRQKFAYDNFLSHNTLELLSDLKKQFGDNLKQMGFLPSGRITSSYENRNSNNLSLFKAVIAASLYPNIASVRWTNLRAKFVHRLARPRAMTPEEGRVNIHPSSVMVPPQVRGKRPDQQQVIQQLCNNPGANWLVYWLKQKSSDLFIIDVTLVYTLPLLFFGEISVTDVDEEDSSDECFIHISGVRVRCARGAARLLTDLRAALDRVLAHKVGARHHHTTHSQFEEAVIGAVIELITAEDEQADYMGGDDADSSDQDTMHDTSY